MCPSPAIDSIQYPSCYFNVHVFPGIFVITVPTAGHHHGQCAAVGQLGNVTFSAPLIFIAAVAVDQKQALQVLALLSTLPVSS
jgi:hypothetical protein